VSSTPLADGVYTVVPTPFDDAGAVDVGSLERLIDFIATCGVEGLLVLGVMGEAPKLVPEERRAVVEAAVDTAAGRCPVIVGVTHPSVHGARTLAEAAEKAGAGAVLLAPPRVDTSGRKETIVAYFRDVAAGLALDVVLHDHPASSGVELSAEMIGRIAHEATRVTSVKLEDPPTPHKLSEVRAAVPESFKIFGGLGGLFVLEELARGANGTMTGFAYPEVLIDVYRAHARGDADEAAATFFRYLPLIRFESQEAVGLAIRKRVYRLRGLIASDSVRSPGTAVDEATGAELVVLLGRLGLGDRVAGAPAPGNPAHVSQG
jgi:4-hydroxy-tetrahydrodipicolinate synthase